MAYAHRKIWQAYRVSTAENAEPTRPESAAQSVEAIVGQWLPLPDVAELLDIPITRVHSLIDERAVLALRIGARKIRSVPAEFFAEGRPLDSLKGTFAVLLDAGYTDAETIAWLFTADDSLPGRPVDALHAGRKTEIRRRAQALAW